jgi:hypothetical protein
MSPGLLRGSARTAALATLAATALVAVAAHVALAADPQISRAQAPAVAAAISLRHGDLPGLKEQPNPITAQETAANDQLTACIGGVPASRALADTQSADFSTSSGTSETVNSATEILPSVALVAKDFGAITGRRGLPCLLAELRGELVGKPPKGETVSGHAWHLAPVVSGAGGAFADRFSVVVRVVHKTTTLILPLYVDLIGFIYGQAEVSLSIETVGSEPSGSLERTLAARLLARARAAIG